MDGETDTHFWQPRPLSSGMLRIFKPQESKKQEKDDAKKVRDFATILHGE